VGDGVARGGQRSNGIRKLIGKTTFLAAEGRTGVTINHQTGSGREVPAW
jgi:hypothetical protein